jgi:predicted RNase H-like nuclease
MVVLGTSSINSVRQSQVALAEKTKHEHHKNDSLGCRPAVSLYVNRWPNLTIVMVNDEKRLGCIGDGGMSDEVNDGTDISVDRG